MKLTDCEALGRDSQVKTPGTARNRLKDETFEELESAQPLAAGPYTLILGPLQMCRVGNKERLYFGDLLRVFL